MSDINTRAAIGQALNLAVHASIAANKAKDTRFILDRFLFYLDLSNRVQNDSAEKIKEWIESLN